MAKKIRINQTLKDALGVKTVWAANPEFKIGPVALNDFTAASDAVNAARNDHASKDEQLSDAKADRDEKVRQLDDLITRFKSGIRSQYGPRFGAVPAGGRNAVEPQKDATEESGAPGQDAAGNSQCGARYASPRVAAPGGIARVFAIPPVRGPIHPKAIYAYLRRLDLTHLPTP